MVVVFGVARVLGIYRDISHIIERQPQQISVKTADNNAVALVNKVRDIVHNAPLHSRIVSVSEKVCIEWHCVDKSCRSHGTDELAAEAVERHYAENDRDRDKRSKIARIVEIVLYLVSEYCRVNEYAVEKHYKNNKARGALRGILGEDDRKDDTEHYKQESAVGCKSEQRDVAESRPVFVLHYSLCNNEKYRQNYKRNEEYPEKYRVGCLAEHSLLAEIIGCFPLHNENIHSRRNNSCGNCYRHGKRQGVNVDNSDTHVPVVVHRVKRLNMTHH